MWLAVLLMQRGILTVFGVRKLVIQIYDNFLSCELLLVFEITFNLIHSKFIYDYAQQ